ncbi:sel1 repeat family protein [Pseudomonas sp. S 311-6]|uniref:tetratricopeptide repeat protein n=1 Tax=Pseudomonas TaxID=286 RepID=UPI002097EAF6|nr:MULTISPECIES: sel1 repeat family protein [Pseudomonas]MCO7564444.1 sel1 repeat family protein [Pseudomonas mosselii]MCO7615846.1 sel1 repeat family protein [Pseudomonas guariconensis]MCO7638723.1 sel1 repeat family protein [Pseudomonas sp. S 311-6]
MTVMTPSRLLLASLALACAGAACAGQSLEQIRYALYKDPSAEVTTDLRALAARGDLASTLLLGDVLAGRDGASRQEVVALYHAAFADGRGLVPALASLARLIDRTPSLREAQRPWMEQALTRYPSRLDPRNASTTLEVFLTYPELVDVEQASQLLGLYEQSCLLNCRPQLYRAVLAERQGDRPGAERWYREAVRVDARAVDRYYRFLGDDQDRAFPAFATALEAERAQLPVEIVHRIASLLDSIASVQRAEQEADRYARQANPPAAGQPAPTPRQLALEQAQADALAQATAQVQRWRDAAVARGFVPAMVSKANYMISNPTEHNAEQTQALIDQVRQREPTRAKALQASFYMVNNWLTLDPDKARALIDELQESGYPDAGLLLAEYYSKGVADQPDQDKALALFREEAAKGSTAAWYRMATLHAYGRAICHDPVKAYTYAQIALNLGERGARSLIKRLEKTLPKDDIERALTARNDLLKEANL